MSYIYVLHFETPLAHARHYTGCTEALKSRLTAHANGAGARLTRELFDLGIEWKLGGLMTTSHKNMRTLERQLKDIAHSDRYCQICTATPRRLPGTIPYDITALNFKTNSRSLRGAGPNADDITCRPSNATDGNQMTMAIRLLMQRDKDALGFIPAGGNEGMTTLLAAGKIIVAERNKEIVGYAAFTTNVAGEQTSIHQCCVRDDVRLFGIGRKLVQCVTDTTTSIQTLAKVRDDLAANHFWSAIGFELQCQKPHPTSGNLINHYLNQKRNTPPC